MKVRRRPLRAGIAALMLVAAPALAQDNVDTLPPGQVRAFLAKFATCTVRKKGPAARVAVAALLAGRAARFPTDDECGSASYYEARLQMSDEVHGDVIANALYFADFGRSVPTSFDAVPLPPPPELQPVAAIEGPAARLASEAHARRLARRYRMIVADCVVRSEPVLAHALLTAPVETRGEQAAIVALQPVIGGCLPTGQTARFTKDSLRGVLAHTAYGLRVALAASAP